MIVLIPTTKERRDKLDLLIPRIRESAGMNHLLVIYENNDGGCAIAQLNAIKSLADDDHMIILNDDMWPMTESWLKILYDKFLETFPDGQGIIQPNDCIQRGKVAVSPFTTVGFYRKYFPTEFLHNFSDTVLTDRARKMGKYAYIRDVVIEHRHWKKGDELDETYKISNKTYARDRELYIKMNNQ